MLENDLLKHVDTLESIKNNSIWSGAASSSFELEISDLINSLYDQIKDVDKFDEALNILNKIKLLDNEIIKLGNSIIEITADMDEETIADNTLFNNGINSTISSKTNDRNELRTKAINILSEFGIIAEFDLLQIPNIEGAEVLFTYDAGCVYKLTTSDGQQYEAYVPYEVDPTAPVIVYDSGGNSSITTDTSGYEWEKWRAYFKEHGFDHIMLRSTRQDNSRYYVDLCDKLNLQPDSRLFIAWSGGFKRQFEEYYDLSMEQGSSPGVLAIMDSYVIRDKRYIDKCKEDGTILLCFYENNLNHPAHESYFGAGEENLNMLIFRDISEFGNSHGGIRDSLYDNNVIDYLTGKGELPDNYVISYYNPNAENADSRGYVTVDHSEVKTLDEVYEFFGLKK